MRKNLQQKFWSHGTPLGYLGPASHQDVRLGACRVCFMDPWGPYEDPVVVVPQVNPENPNTAGARCGSVPWLQYIPSLSRGSTP